MENGKMKRKYKTKKLWSTDAEELLIELWADNIEQLRAQRKHNHIYQDIQRQMEKRSFLFSAEEIRIKIHNLTSRYRREKGEVGTSGGSPSEWPLYFKIHKILGKFKLNNVELLVEESIMDGIKKSTHLYLSDSSEVPPPARKSNTGKRKKIKNIHVKLLKEFRKINKNIEKELKHTQNIDERLVTIEEKRNELLQEFVNDSKEFQKTVINLLGSK